MLNQDLDNLTRPGPIEGTRGKRKQNVIYIMTSCKWIAEQRMIKIGRQTLLGTTIIGGRGEPLSVNSWRILFVQNLNKIYIQTAFLEHDNSCCCYCCPPPSPVLLTISNARFVGLYAACICRPWLQYVLLM